MESFTKRGAVFLLAVAAVLIGIGIWTGAGVDTDEADRGAEVVTNALVLAGGTCLGAGFSLASVSASLAHSRDIERERVERETAQSARDRFLEGQVEVLERALYMADSVVNHLFDVWNAYEEYTTSIDPDRRSQLESLAREAGHAFYAARNFRRVDRLAALIDDEDAAAATSEIGTIVAQWIGATMIDVHVAGVDVPSGWNRAAELGCDASAAAARIEGALHRTMRARWGHEEDVNVSIRP